MLVRTAVFKSTSSLIAFLLQTAADRIDASYQPKPKEQFKGRVSSTVECIFGSFKLERLLLPSGQERGALPGGCGSGYRNREHSRSGPPSLPGRR